MLETVDNRSPVAEGYRICHVIDHLLLHGAQVYLAKLVRGLSLRGYQQMVFGLNDPRSQEIVNMLSSAGARVETIGKLRILSLQGLFRMWSELRGWRPHLVQTILPISDVIGRCVARLAGVPVIVSVCTQPNVGRFPPVYTIERMTAPWVKRVVFNSRTIIPFATSREGVKPHQVAFIPNGIEIDPPSQPEAGAAMRAALGIPPDAMVIGTVARLYVQKGHVHLLDAFARVLKEFPAAVLVLVGDGPLRNDLETRASGLGIANSVRFLGDRSDLRDLLECMDLYVQSSLWEGMSVALMQAMLCGLPVVATSVDGTIEVLEDGKTGLLVTPGDSMALAEGIVHALRHTEETTRIARQGADLIREHYSVERMVDSFDRLYQGLIAESRAKTAQMFNE